LAAEATGGGFKLVERKEIPALTADEDDQADQTSGFLDSDTHMQLLDDLTLGDTPKKSLIQLKPTPRLDEKPRFVRKSAPKPQPV
jgi:hypothetical protein